MENISINQLLSDTTLLNENNGFGFYDWFCDNKSLARRYKRLIPKLRFLVKEGLINGDLLYVWFKNNCPVYGSLYDDIRISTLDDNDFLGGFSPRSGHNGVGEKCSIWGLKDGEFTYELSYLNWSTFKQIVKENKELRETISKQFLVK